MNWRKTIITGLILSFALAIYNIFFQPLWFKYMEAQGRATGVAETALGYFGAIMLTTIITWFVTRRMNT